MTGSHRVRDGKVYLRLRGREWLAGPEGEWPASRIRQELEKEVAAVRLGAWHGPPIAVPPSPHDLPTVQEAASDYVEFHRRQWSAKTARTCRWLVQGHLLPYFGAVRVDRVTRASVENYMKHKQDEREYIRTVRAKASAQKPLGPEEQAVIDRRLRGLDSDSINRSVNHLAAILDREMDEHPEHMPTRNPARLRKGQRLKVAPANRAALDLDQVDALFRSAKALDAHARQDRRNLGRQVMVITLVTAGLRISELCNARRRDVDLRRGRLVIPAAKTTAGQREVHLSAFAVAYLDDYMHRVAPYRAPNDPLFPTTTGRHRDVNRFRDRILQRAVADADQLLDADRQRSGGSHPAPMPDRVTPHTLRRTYVTLALENGESPRWLMGQVGHRDAHLIMEVYGQVAQRRGVRDPRLRMLLGEPGVW